MNSNESKVQEILKQRGIDTAAVDDATEADIPEPCERFKQLMEGLLHIKGISRYGNSILVQQNLVGERW